MIKSKIPRPQKENLRGQQLPSGKVGGGSVKVKTSTHSTLRDSSAHRSDRPTSAPDSDTLSCDVAYNSDFQCPSSPEEDPDPPGLADIGDYTVAEDEDTDQQELQKAIEEMARLDAVLLSAACKEKVAKRQLRDSKSKLWQKLQEKIPYGHIASAKEAKNTEMFLALDSSFGFEERDDIVTARRSPDDDQPPTSPPRLEASQPELSGWSPTSSLPSTSDQMRKLIEGETDFGETAGSSSRGTNPEEQATSPFDAFFDEQILDQRDNEAEDMVMTEAEKARLAELLWDINEGNAERGQGDSERNFSMDDCYTPEASELEALREIDAKLRKLLSDEEFLSVQSTFTSSLEGP